MLCRLLWQPDWHVPPVNCGHRTWRTQSVPSLIFLASWAHLEDSHLCTLTLLVLCMFSFLPSLQIPPLWALVCFPWDPACCLVKFPWIVFKEHKITTWRICLSNRKASGTKPRTRKESEYGSSIRAPQTQQEDWQELESINSLWTLNTTYNWMRVERRFKVGPEAPRNW